jgi:hypothetical protein
MGVEPLLMCLIPRGFPRLSLGRLVRLSRMMLRLQHGVPGLVPCRCLHVVAVGLELFLLRRSRVDRRGGRLLGRGLCARRTQGVILSALRLIGAMQIAALFRQLIDLVLIRLLPRRQTALLLIQLRAGIGGVGVKGGSDWSARASTSASDGSLVVWVSDAAAPPSGVVFVSVSN